MKRTALSVGIGTIALAGLLLTGCSGDGSGGDAGNGGEGGDALSGTVTLLLPNTTTTRFIEHDGPAFVAAMGELAPDITVEVVNAEGDAAKQLQQAETAILNGSKALVLVSADPALSGSVLAAADASSVPVIAYEHEALDGPVSYQVIFDPLKVGQAQGVYFGENLPETDGPVKVARIYGNNGDNYTTKVKEGQDETVDALVDSGEVEVVCEDYAAGWDPANAQQILEQCLTQTGNDIDAVLVSNDGTAAGAIAALESQQLSGELPVYGGQDANLDAVRYILQGLQTSTVFKDYALEGSTAAELLVSLLSDEEPGDAVNATFDNGFADIPAAYLDVQSIDASNVQILIDGGLYTKEEICDGLTVDFCN